MSLIDAAIDNYGGNDIIHEQHDVNQIDFVAGMTDPGEMIRCGYRSDLRRQQGEQDAAYAVRIRPLVMAMLPQERDIILNAALRRAGLDTSAGGVAAAYAKRPAWTKLGVTFRDVFTSKQGIVAARMNWKVSKEAMYYRGPNNEMVESDDTFALIRQDTRAKLGTVGARYEVIQNEDGFDFLDSLLSEFGARYESAGSLYGGKRVWMQVHLPKQSFTVNGKDKVDAYGVFTNPHDGSGKALLFPYNDRVECGNTCRIAIDRSRGKGLGLRHSGKIRDKMNDARRVLGLAIKGFEKFGEKAQALVQARVNPTYYANDVLDAAIKITGITAADAARGADVLAAALDVTEAQRELEVKLIQKKIDRRQGIIEDILTRYESSTNNVNGMRGTAWSAFNAITESVNYGKLGGRFRGDEEKKASRQFVNTMTGDGDDVIQIALEQAVALAV